MKEELLDDIIKESAPYSPPGWLQLQKQSLRMHYLLPDYYTIAVVVMCTIVLFQRRSRNVQKWLPARQGPSGRMS